MEFLAKAVDTKHSGSCCFIPIEREQRVFEVKPFCPCFDFVCHRNGGSTNLHQVLCEKRIQGCRKFLDVANSLRGCRHAGAHSPQNLEVPAGPLNLCVPPTQSRFGPLRLLPFWKAKKKKLKGRKFQSIEKIKVESKKAMKAIPKTDYQRCFADWKKRWLKFIAANGDYFEGDNLNLTVPKKMAGGVLDRLRFLPIKKMDQRTCIKFCVKNEIKCADAFRMLTVEYGEATLDRSNVYRWYKMYSEGREDVNDEERAGRSSTSTTDEKINEVEKMILANRRITVREVAEDLNISIGSCHSIFINDLGMRRVAAKFVPKLLNCDQKQHRMNIANEMLDSVRDDPNLLQRVITGDEAWVYGYDVETKAQSSQWKLPHEPRPKKARQVRSNVKVLLTVFFDCRGVVHYEFLPQGRTVNKE
ncbi:hypothetical protein LAZ67_X002707 [Cordylochernes scorpioides]|uniref:Mos1 transposase HTH domain-containing protein n=1 Tax=Cordylochernes scorpioides TaxID=51811 RepID=A0ABY6LTK1_9ARAC|nr:hypothetical protein LAZ67_X002707 [Cordylochernes scorpioides]